MQLQKEATQANLNQIAIDLRNVTNSPAHNSTALSLLATDAENIDKNEVKAVNDSKNKLITNINLLNTKSQQILVSLSSVIYMPHLLTENSFY